VRQLPRQQKAECEKASWDVPGGIELACRRVSALIAKLASRVRRETTADAGAVEAHTEVAARLPFQSMLDNAIARRWPCETPLIQHPADMGAAAARHQRYLPHPHSDVGLMRNQTEDNIRAV